MIVEQCNAHTLVTVYILWQLNYIFIQTSLPQMQNKIESLQEELHQAKKSNHNHTFADAERTAEVSVRLKVVP